MIIKLIKLIPILSILGILNLHLSAATVSGTVTFERVTYPVGAWEIYIPYISDDGGPLHANGPFPPTVFTNDQATWVYNNEEVDEVFGILIDNGVDPEGYLQDLREQFVGLGITVTWSGVSSSGGGGGGGGPVVTASQGTDSQVCVTWDPVPGANGYVVEFGTDGAFTDTAAQGVLIIDPSITSAKGNADGTFYNMNNPVYVRVRAFESVPGVGTVHGEWSTPVTGWPAQVPTGYCFDDSLIPPNDVTASNGTFEGMVKLNWSAVPGATGYAIYRSVLTIIDQGTYVAGVGSTYPSHDNLLIGETTSLSFDDLNADEGTANSSGSTFYYYYVKTIRDDCRGRASGPMGGRPKVSTVSDLQANLEDAKIKLTWTQPRGNYGYTIYRNTVDSTVGATVIKDYYSGWAKLSAVPTSFHDTGAENGKLYYYLIETRGINGNTNTGNIVSINSPNSGVAYTVTFVEGPNGLRSGGGILVQTVDHGNSAVEPTIAANPGYSFTGWNTVSTNVTSNLTVTAQYLAAVDSITSPDNPATPPNSNPSSVITAGTSKYSGLLSSTDGSEGLGYFKSIKVSKAGKLSAKMYFGNVSYSLKGLFDENGQYSGVITPRSGSPATVDLQLVKTTGGGYKVEGTVIVDAQTAIVSAVKSGSTSSQSGVYTILVLGEEDESSAPQGHGYAMMTVTSVGTAKIKGLLGDGSKWTAKCHVTPDGEMPLYAALYKKAGSLGGLVRFRNVSGMSDCDAEVHWRKPGGTGIVPFSGGFNLQRNLIGSRYSYTGGRLIAGIPNTVPNVEAQVGEGSGDSESSWDLEWTTANKIYYAGPEKVKVSVETKTGQIKGYVTDDGTKLEVEGVVFQKQDLGVGLVYVKRGEPRSLVIVPME